MQVKKAHFIGIGGVGMSPTAKLLRDAGVEVTGSDEEVYPPVSDFLKQEGFIYKTPYAAANIPSDADTIIIGKNAKLVPESNAEVAAALLSGKRILSYPEVLGELSEGKETVVIVGSYGKSSTTALLSHCLLEAGQDPSFFIGAIPYTPKTSAKIGNGSLFVLEGDEYPSSNTDTRAKFLHYHPAHLIITPLAHDHFNVFPTPFDYIAPFKELISLLPSSGSLVVSVAGVLSKDFIASLPRPAVTYGVYEGDYHAANIAWGEKTSFSVMHGETPVITVETSELGEHSIENIVGVAAFLFSRSLVTPEQFKKAVASFRGIKRRLDKKSNRTSVPVYEGFGSSYAKMQNAVAAMRIHFAERRLLVVFEPNTIAWRSRSALRQYDDVFRGVAKVYIFNPPHDGKETELGAEEITERVEASGTPAVAMHTAEEALGYMARELLPGDVLLLSSSGAMGGLPESIPRLLEQKFPK